VSDSGRETQVFLSAIIVALLLQLVQLPAPLGPLKPWFLGMVVCYYVLEQPRYIGLGRAFLIGLTADALNGALFGEQAFRLCILTYLLLRFRYRLRFFPLWQQTALIAVLFFNDCILALWIRLLGTIAQPGFAFWLTPLTAAFLWPFLFVLLDRARRWRRPAPRL
jgi:rod shape-determining protein MreD